MPILVTYATAKGSTREIAQRIASCLEVFTNPIECKPIEEVEISSLGNYSAIIIGSAVHMQSWLKKAHEFIHDNAATLNSKPVWAFSVGLPKGEADRLREEEVINKKIKKDLVCLQRHQLFRGRWDMKDFWYLKFFLIAFDASADIKTENWLSLADGYAVQRGITGWPMGAGWPKPKDSAEKTARQLEAAEARTVAEAESKLDKAKTAQGQNHSGNNNQSSNAVTASKEVDEEPEDLGYCTIWVGTTKERPPASASEPPRPKAVKEDWQLMEPDAGIAVIYFPFLSNPKVSDVDPATSDYMSTWNFVYTPEDIDNVVNLARANFEEGQEQTRMCVRAVYERKKKKRLEREQAEMAQLFQTHVREAEKMGRETSSPEP